MNIWEQIANQFFKKEFEDYKKKTAAGRRPDSVEFTTIDKDVMRRDLTINALFYDISTEEVVDLVGGIDDLNNGVVRTVGNPRERFDEDKLRIMRIIRFAARTGHEVDSLADQELKKDASMQGISKERIRDEFLKGIKSALSVKYFFELLNKYKLFDWVFTGLNVDTDFNDEKDPIVSIAYLLRNNKEQAVADCLQNSKYTANEIKAISFLLLLKKFNGTGVYELKKSEEKSKVSEEQIMKFANLTNMRMDLIGAFCKFKLRVTGQMLQNMGVPNGAEMGAKIRQLEDQNFSEFLRGS